MLSQTAWGWYEDETDVEEYKVDNRPNAPIELDPLGEALSKYPVNVVGGLEPEFIIKVMLQVIHFARKGKSNPQC